MNSSWGKGAFETVSDGRVFDEIKAVVSPASIRGDGTEILNNFVHFSKSFVLSPDL